jgi:hypothetical protein
VTPTGDDVTVDFTFIVMSDLDELSQEYEDCNPKARTKTGGYRISGALTAPSATMYSTETLHSAWRSTNIAIFPLSPY